MSRDDLTGGLYCPKLRPVNTNITDPSGVVSNRAKADCAKDPLQPHSPVDLIDPFEVYYVFQ